MAASRERIAKWFDTGKVNGQTHMVVFCDDFEYEDYPSYVPDQSSLEEALSKDGRNMQRIMEVYNYSLDREEQLNEFRAWHP